jgi:hypothetical protein
MDYFEEIAHSSVIPSSEERQWLKEEGKRLLHRLRTQECNLISLCLLHVRLFTKRHALVLLAEALFQRGGTSNVSTSLKTTIQHFNLRLLGNQDSKDWLAEETQDLRTAIKCCIAASRTARRLPSKVLDKIFWHAIPVDEAGFVVNSFTCSEAPWNVSQVCWKWRNTAFKQAQLWSFFGSERCFIPENRLNLLRRQLSYCSGLPVTISVACGKRDALPLDIEYSLLDVLDPYFVRCLQLRLALDVRRYQLLSNLCPKFERLETLEVYSTEAKSAEEPGDGLNTIHNVSWLCFFGAV